MALLVGLVAALVGGFTVYVGLAVWGALAGGHSGLMGLLFLFAVLYGAGVVAGSVAGFGLIRWRVSEAGEDRLRLLAIVSVAGAILGSAGYFGAWFSGLLPGPT